MWSKACPWFAYRRALGTLDPNNMIERLKWISHFEFEKNGKYLRLSAGGLAALAFAVVFGAIAASGIVWLFEKNVIELGTNTPRDISFSTLHLNAEQTCSAL